MKRYKKFYEEGGERKEAGEFEAKDRTDAFKKIRPLNTGPKGKWRFYFFEEIEEQTKPVIKRTVAV